MDVHYWNSMMTELLRQVGLLFDWLQVTKEKKQILASITGVVSNCATSADPAKQNFVLKEFIHHVEPHLDQILACDPAFLHEKLDLMPLFKEVHMSEYIPRIPEEQRASLMQFLRGLAIQGIVILFFDPSILQKIQGIFSNASQPPKPTDMMLLISEITGKTRTGGPIIQRPDLIARIFPYLLGDLNALPEGQEKNMAQTVLQMATAMAPQRQLK